MSINTELICDVQIDGINWNDAPKFVDAYICEALWSDSGEKLTEKELSALNDDADFVYKSVQEWIY